MSDNFSNTSHPDECSRRSRSLLHLLLGISLVLLSAFVFTGAGLRSTGSIEVGLMEVSPKLFQIEIERRGVVEPMKSTEVRSKCYWSTDILSIVPEGTWVKKDDVVCVLDASNVEDYRQTRELILLKYRSRLDAAKHDQTMLSSDNERKLEAARFKHQTASFNLNEYQSARFPQQVQELEQELSILSDRSTSVIEATENMESLWAAGLIGHREMEAQTVKLLSAREEYRRKEAELNLLTQFENPRTEVQLSHTRTQSLRNVSRVQLGNSLAETRARLSVLSVQRTIRIYEGYYQRALDSIEACTIRAPCDGQVFYGNSWYLMSRGITHIAEGNRVRRRQKVFEIPDLTRLKVSVPLDESLIYKVWDGMPVEVAIAGFEDEVIAGRVVSIPRYPRPRSSYTPGIKDYWLDVELLPTERQYEFINVKADATVKLALDRVEDAIRIPRDAITGLAGQNFVCVFDGEELVPREVSLGSANDEFACVTSGLNEGEQLVTHMTEQHRALLEGKLEAALAAK